MIGIVRVYKNDEYVWTREREALAPEPASLAYQLIAEVKREFPVKTMKNFTIEIIIEVNQ